MGAGTGWTHGNGSVRFGVLGPLLATRNGTEVTLRGGKPGLLLLALLLEPGHPVPADRLVDALWKGEPPPTARASLSNQVHALQPGRLAGWQPAPVRRRSGSAERCPREGNGEPHRLAAAVAAAVAVAAAAVAAAAGNGPPRLGQPVHQPQAIAAMVMVRFA